MEKAGDYHIDIEVDVKNAIEEANALDRQLRSLERGFDRTSGAVSNTERAMGRLSRVATALFAAISVQQVAQYADAWATANNKLVNAVRPHEQLADVTERVFNITQQTRGSLDATASLYARLERATRQYGTSADDLAKLTTIINQGFVVSGATAQEAENAIIQLSQGLASGALRGEEFNSVNEQGNRLIVALADSMGVTIGQMRALAAEGKLTTDVVVNGLLSQGATIGNEFAKTTATISQSLQVAGNNITKFFGENSTVKSGVAVFNDAVIGASEHIETLSGALTVAAGVMGSRYVAALTLAGLEQAKQAKSTLSQVIATRTRAREEAAAAAVTARRAQADKAAALSALNVAQAEYNVARGSAAEATAMSNLIRLRTAYTEAGIIASQSNNALAASQARVAATGLTIKNVMNGLNVLTAPLGGLVGAATLAAGAVFYFYQKAQQARQEAIDFADGIDNLRSSMNAMSNTSLRGTIADANQAMKGIKEEISDVSDEIKALQEEQRKAAEASGELSSAFGENNYFASIASDLTDKLAQKQRRLDELQKKLTNTTELRNDAQNKLNANMLAAMGQHDGLIEKGNALVDVQDAVAHAFGRTAALLNKSDFG